MAAKPPPPKPQRFRRIRSGARRGATVARAGYGGAQAVQGATSGAVASSGFGGIFDGAANILIALTGIGILGLVVTHPQIPAKLLSSITSLMTQVAQVGTGAI